MGSIREILEGDFVYPDFHGVFHGTSAANAEALVAGRPMRPLKEQASDFVSQFGVSFDQIYLGEEFSSMRHYIFERSRDTSLSCTDVFDKARNYALRIPEWQLFLFDPIHRITKPGANEESLNAMVNEYIESQPDPVVLTIRRQQFDYRPYRLMETPTYLGIEIVLNNPLADGDVIDSIVRIKRN